MEKVEKIIQFLSEYFKLNLNLKNISVFFAFLFLLVPALIKVTKFIVRKYKSRTLSSDLEPFFYYSEVEKAITKFIPTRFQNVNPGNYNDINDNQAFALSQNLIKHFLKTVFKTNRTKSRYYIILADAGMGKTTFMINLYYKYKSTFSWFGLKGKFQIRLFPLGDEGTINTLSDIKDEARKTILLLDAFDEFDPKNAITGNKMDFLLAKVSRFKEVIITSRTNFFKKSEEEPHKTGLIKLGPNPEEWKFGKFYISPFSDRDVIKYIRKHIPIYRFTKRRKAKQLLLNYHDLKFRPMLVSYLWDLLDIPGYHKYKYLIYEFLIEKWIEREVVKSKNKQYYKEELYKFSLELTRYFISYKTSHIYVDDLITLTTNYNINLNELDVTSRSLLNRNVENMYKFSHKTIFEYFASYLLFSNEISKENIDLETNDLILVFYKEMCENLLINPLLDTINLKPRQKYDFETKTKMEEYLGCKCFDATGSTRQSVLYIFNYDSLLNSKYISKRVIDLYPKLKDFFQPI